MDFGLYWTMLLPPLPTFAVDLFLVGSNAASLTRLNWPDAKDEAPVQRLLREIVTPLLAVKRTVVVMDGGDGSLFGGAKPQGTVGYWKRSYDAYDSMTETVNGKTRVLARAEREETETGGVSVGANDPKARYSSQSYLHFGTEKDHPMVSLMDLNTYRYASLEGYPQDKQYLPMAILFSDDSKSDTERLLARTGLRPPGPVICRTGYPRAGDRTVVAFPPEGVVGHYRMVQEGPGWRLEFVRFYR